MDTEKISKLLWEGYYNSPDNLLGKNLLIKYIPNIKDYLKEYAGAQNLDREYLIKFGIEVPKSRTTLSFDKEHFPELWEEKEEVK